MVMLPALDQHTAACVPTDVMLTMSSLSVKGEVLRGCVKQTNRGLVVLQRAKSLNVHTCPTAHPATISQPMQ